MSPLSPAGHLRPLHQFQVPSQPWGQQVSLLGPGFLLSMSAASEAAWRRKLAGPLVSVLPVCPLVDLGLCKWRVKVVFWLWGPALSSSKCFQRNQSEPHPSTEGKPFPNSMRDSSQNDPQIHTKSSMLYFPRILYRDTCFLQGRESHAPSYVQTLEGIPCLLSCSCVLIT